MIDTFLGMVKEELVKSNKAHDCFKSNHEGIAVIHGEFIELRDLVYKQKSTHTITAAMINEAVQLAAMACKFLCCRTDQLAKVFEKKESFDDIFHLADKLAMDKDFDHVAFYKMGVERLANDQRWQLLTDVLSKEDVRKMADIFFNALPVDDCDKSAKVFEDAMATVAPASREPEEGKQTSDNKRLSDVCAA